MSDYGHRMIVERGRIHADSVEWQNGVTKESVWFLMIKPAGWASAQSSPPGSGVLTQALGRLYAAGELDEMVALILRRYDSHSYADESPEDLVSHL